MAEKCSICGGDVVEEYGKLKGTMLKVVEDKKKKWIYVCSVCQKDPKHVETAKIKSV